MNENSIDWDDAYDNMGHIPNSEHYPPNWAKSGENFRAAWPHQELDIRYGEHPRERLDLFRPEGAPLGLAMFIHGGYWMRLDKSYWSELAHGALQAGYSVAIPSYTLTPDIRISAITKQITKAVSLAAKRAHGPIFLAGHSAGGHLATRMLCEDSQLEAGILNRIAHVLSISGLHDLGPLIKTKMNATLRLDKAEARLESSALHQPIADIPVTAWVGGGERPEFIRQSRLLEAAWPNCTAVIDGDHHHFSVIEGLSRAGSPITRSLLGASSEGRA